MKILVIAPFNLPIPPFKGYGGTQRIIYDIVQRLKDSDDVSLFAPAESAELANLELLTYSSRDPEACMDEIVERLEHEEYDLVYSHYSSPELARRIIRQGHRLVVASYFYYDKEKMHEFSELDCYMQSLSYSHGEYLRQHLADRVISVKYSMDIQGVEPSLWPVSMADEYEITLDMLRSLRRQNKDYLLIVSRICDYKGQATAIKLAQQAGMTLIIAGEPVSRTEGDFNYFEQMVKPYIDGKQILYFGNANESERNELMRYAKATILPTGFENRQWHEAYGRVVNESLACGTPVIATNRDAMPEQIEHGVSGFLFDTFAEALTYCRQIDTIDRQACINRVKTHLNVDRFMQDLRPQLMRVANVRQLSPQR